MSACTRLLFLLLMLLTAGTMLFPWGVDEAVPAAEAETVPQGNHEEQRIRMVSVLIESRDVDEKDVLQAMRAVPRHLFVPPEYMSRAYNDHALPIGYGQTISQPYIVAYMTRLLEIKPGDVILEIGTGSGYQAAVLAELTDAVYTIEIIDELAAEAAERLDRLGYDGVRTRNADGYWGWPEAAPFDGIIVTAAAGHVPPPLIEQLQSGGRLVIPVGHSYDFQYITLIEKTRSGRLIGRQLLPVRFVPFTGYGEQTGP